MNPMIRDISRSRATIPVGILVSLILTVLTSMFLRELIPSVQQGNMLWDTVESWKGNMQRGIILNLLLAIAGGWGIFKINEVFSLSHTRSNLPFLFYLLLQITNAPLQFFSEGSIAVLAGLPAITVLFASYQQKRGAEQAFWVGLFWAVLCLFWTKAIFYIPVLLFGFWFMRSAGFRVFLAFIFGLAVPYWLQFSWLFFQDRTEQFLLQFGNLTHFSLTGTLSLPLYLQINLAATLLLAMISGTYLLVTNFREKVRTQACFNFLILLSMTSAAMCIADSGNLTGHLTLFYITVAFLASNIFIKVQTKLITTLFLMIIAAYSTAYVYSLWIN